MRTVVAIEYSLFGRFEFTCSPAGMFKTIDPLAVEPRATEPPPSDPLTVCEFADKTPAAKTTIKATNDTAKTLIFIYCFGWAGPGIISG